MSSRDLTTENTESSGGSGQSGGGGDAVAGDTAAHVTAAVETATTLASVVESKTVHTSEALDEDRFFETADGRTTVVNRYDLEKTVPTDRKPHFREVTRYWVNEPYSFVVIFHSAKENEEKYYLIEPYLTPIEEELQAFLTGKLKTGITYSSDETVVQGDESERAAVIETEVGRLLDRYDLYDGPVVGAGTSGLFEKLKRLLGRETAESTDENDEFEGIASRPESAVLDEDAKTLTEYQVEKLLYRLKRDCNSVHTR